MMYQGAMVLYSCCFRRFQLLSAEVTYVLSPSPDMDVIGRRIEEVRLHGELNSGPLHGFSRRLTPAAGGASDRFNVFLRCTRTDI
jgi:hypothetical protein